MPYLQALAEGVKLALVKPKIQGANVMITFAVGQHFRCVVVMPKRPKNRALAIVAVSWLPSTPNSKLTTGEMIDYRNGLTAALREAAKRIGVYPMLVEPAIGQR